MAANWFVKDMALMSLKQVSKILSQSLSLKCGYTLSGYIWWFKDTQLIKYAEILPGSIPNGCYLMCVNTLPFL